MVKDYFKADDIITYIFNHKQSGSVTIFLWEPHP